MAPQPLDPNWKNVFPPNLLNDVQGDILFGFPKKAETFWVFTITNPAAFKAALKSIIPQITTSQQAFDNGNKVPAPTLIPMQQINVAFSFKGLQALNVVGGNQFDQAFTAGMSSPGEASFLGDSTKNLLPPWTQQSRQTKPVHGVFMLAGDSRDRVNGMLAAIQVAFNGAAAEVIREEGFTRPGSQDGHEHFGFEDGVSNPAIAQLQKPFNGQKTVPFSHVVVTGGNTMLNNGSYLCFRHLNQDVNAFNQYVAANVGTIGDNDLKTWFDPNDPTSPADKKTKLFGARTIGRWQSGCPMLSSTGAPMFDGGVAVTNDPNANNNFDFTAGTGASVGDPNGAICPFQSHIRKTNPRDDVDESTRTDGLIMRRGMQFGTEFTEHPTDPRGLLFACYQAEVFAFKIVQKFWANANDFHTSNVGVDIIIGQPEAPQLNKIGTSGNGVPPPSELVTFGGGEYFFSPSLTALSSVITV